MMLNVKAFTGTVAILTAVSYVLCAVTVSIMPELRDLAIQFLIHVDVDFETVQLSFGLHVLSFVIWVVGMSILAWLFAVIYNRLATLAK